MIRKAVAYDKKVTLIPADPSYIQEEFAFRQIPTAAYARVSTELEEQQSSYETQIAYYTDKIMSNTEWALVGIYSDDGISGTQAKKRPGFMKMIDDCKKGKIKQILVKSISRFARNTLESIHYVRMLKELGVAIIFEKEHINTMDIDSETFITLQSCMAQAESESISGNIKWAYRKAFSQGKVIYNFKHWYGYERGKDGQPVVIPGQAEIVRGIFADYLGGQSLKQITDGLNGRGLRRKDGVTEWLVSTIQSMLRNERYCGDAISQKTYTKDCLTKKVVKNHGEVPMYYITDAHPAIIERSMFNRIQEEMARRSGKRARIEKHGTTGRAKHSGKYALSDLLVCGECGTAYRRCTWVRNGQKTIVWRCLNRLTYGTKYCKNSPTIREAELHETILAAIREHLSDRDALMGMLTRNLDAGLAMTREPKGRAVTQTNLWILKEQFLEKTRSIQESELDEASDVLAAMADEIRDMEEKLVEISDSTSVCERKTHSGQELAGLLSNVQLQLEEYDDGLARRLIHTVKVSMDKITVIHRQD